jgi:NAD(P)-dependent dehydrogenase (short-subunit alcohol dehydrogenase family)
MPRSALVTGASRGLGREIARGLAQAGLRLFVTGRDAPLVHTLRDELACGGAEADLRHADQALALCVQARQHLGRIDVLVNNAGFNRAKTPIRELTPEELDEAYAVNVRAPMLLSREALKEMGERGSGHIVNIISSIVHARMERYSVYTSMKCALHGFTGCLIKEARALGVKVTGVYPGGVNTGFRAVPRPDYLRPESAAAMVVQCIMAPEDIVVHELTFRPIVETNF